MKILSDDQLELPKSGETLEQHLLSLQSWRSNRHQECSARRIFNCMWFNNPSNCKLWSWADLHRIWLSKHDGKRSKYGLHGPNPQAQGINIFKTGVFYATFLS